MRGEWAVPLGGFGSNAPTTKSCVYSFGKVASLPPLISPPLAVQPAPVDKPVLSSPRRHSSSPAQFRKTSKNSSGKMISGGKNNNKRKSSSDSFKDDDDDGNNSAIGDGKKSSGGMHARSSKRCRQRKTYRPIGFSKKGSHHETPSQPKPGPPPQEPTRRDFSGLGYTAKHRLQPLFVFPEWRDSRSPYIALLRAWSDEFICYPATDELKVRRGVMSFVPLFANYQDSGL